MTILNLVRKQTNDGPMGRKIRFLNAAAWPPRKPPAEQMTLSCSKRRHLPRLSQSPIQPQRYGEMQYRRGPL